MTIMTKADMRPMRTSVTLTFNLFFENDDGNNEKDTSRPQSRFTDPPVDRLVEALRLPGQFDESRPRLCFHLQHRYVSDSL